MAHPGTLHKYSHKHVAFEHASPSSPSPQNTLLFIGGLSDGLLTVPYPTSIATSLPPPWSLVEVLLSSSYAGWGTSSLAADARELGECVAYFRSLRPGGKIVLMGHSTGCQDAMEYVLGSEAETRPRVDGVVLQGGVSDRQAWEDMLSPAEYKAVVAQAKEWIDAGKGKEVIPSLNNPVIKEFGGAISAYRLHSLLAEGGDDDYFSSDLSDSQLSSTFGKIPSNMRVCLLLGEKDPYVPASVDKAALLARWTRVVRQGGGMVDDVHGGVVAGAHHNLDGDPEDVVGDLVNRVCGFLRGLDEGSA